MVSALFDDNFFLTPIIIRLLVSTKTQELHALGFRVNFALGTNLSKIRNGYIKPKYYFLTRLVSLFMFHVFKLEGFSVGLFSLLVPSVSLSPWPLRRAKKPRAISAFLDISLAPEKDKQCQINLDTKKILPVLLVYGFMSLFGSNILYNNLASFDRHIVL